MDVGDRRRQDSLYPLPRAPETTTHQKNDSMGREEGRGTLVGWGIYQKGRGEKISIDRKEGGEDRKGRERN